MTCNDDFKERTMSYIAYIPVPDQTGQIGVVNGEAQTAGLAIKEAASRLNTAVAQSGGYDDASSVRVMVIVYSPPAGTTRLEHVIDTEKQNITVHLMNEDNERGEPLTPMLVMNINPIEASSDQFLA